MPRFVLRSDAPIDLYHPAGHNASLRVEPGQVVDTPGDLVADAAADAYVVDNAGELLAWPHALWQLDEKPAPPVAPVTPAVTEED